MKIKILSKLRIPEDQMKAATALLTELRLLITQQPGYILTEILRRHDDPCQFLFLTTWQSMAHWERWCQSAERKIIIEKMRFIEESDNEIYDYGTLR